MKSMKAGLPIRKGGQCLIILLACLSGILLYYISPQVQFYKTALKASQMDVVRFSKEILPSRPTTSEVRVLIVAYYRSGSTLAGSLFDENNNTFYHFEPLYPLYVRIMRERLALKYFNGTERKCPGDDKEARPVAMHILTSIFDCRLEELDVKTLSLMMCADKSQSATAFCLCKKWKSSRRIHKYCLPDYRNQCLLSKYRVIKTIRVDMDTVESLLQIYPDLKVIHLLRDPRGRLCSNIVARKCNVTDGYVKKLCDSGSNDISSRLMLEKKYPNSFKEVIYEDLVADPERTAEAIFKFVGTELPLGIKNNLKKKLGDAGLANGPYGTYRKNGLETAYKWSKSISWEVVQLVNRHCEAVIQHARFPHINTEKELESFQIPDRLKLVQLNT